MKIFLALLIFFLPLTSIGADFASTCYVFQSLEFSAGTTSARAVDPGATTTNGTVRCVVIQNKSAGSTLYVKINSQHTTTEGYYILQGESLQIYNMPNTSYYIRSSAGTISTSILLGNDRPQ